MTDTRSTDEATNRIETLDEGPCRKRMKVEIPTETVSQELATTLKQLRGNVQFPGFRKGKTPMAMVKSRFGKQVEADVQQDLLRKAFGEEVERSQLRVLGTPDFENIEFKDGSPFTFEVIFDVEPIFDTPKYKGLEIEAEKVEISKEDVEKELEALLSQFATAEPIEIDDLGEGDLAVVDVAVVDSAGKNAFERPEVMLKMGHDHVDNIEVEGLSERLCEAKAGETVDFEVKVPDQFPTEELRGETATLRIVLKDAKRTQVPEVDEDFLGKIGIDSKEKLLEELEKGIEQRRSLREEQRQEEELIDKVAAAVEMELPASLVEERKQNVTMSTRFRLMREGKSEEEVEAALPDDESAEEEAREELRKLFILERIVGEEKILVTEDEVLNRLAAIARSYQKPLEAVVEEYRNNGMLGELRNGMRREKAKSLLRKKAKAVATDG